MKSLTLKSTTIEGLKENILSEMENGFRPNIAVLVSPSTQNLTKLYEFLNIFKIDVIECVLQDRLGSDQSIMTTLMDTEHSKYSIQVKSNAKKQKTSKLVMKAI